MVNASSKSTRGTVCCQVCFNNSVKRFKSEAENSAKISAKKKNANMTSSNNAFSTFTGNEFFPTKTERSV